MRGPVASRELPSGSVEGLGAYHETVVGPYDIVHVAGGDPMAMTSWLVSNGYEIPVEAQPVIDAYAARGMGFVIARLRPSTGVDLMQPIRVRMPGLGLTLPLQMVGIGAGTTIDLELFVLAEGRMEAANFGNAEIDRAALAYDYDAQTFNYEMLAENALFSGTGPGTNWVTDAAFMVPVATMAAYTSTGPMGDMHSAAIDLGIVTANVPAPYLTHLVTRPARTELTGELILRSSSGADVPTALTATSLVHHDDCPDTGILPTDAGGARFARDVGHAAQPSHRECTCGVARTEPPTSITLALAILGLARLRRRSRRRAA
jgi:hypothetical protein